MAAGTRIAIAGIHTGIGKTIGAAVLTQALEADYWKPLQAGTEEETDRMTVSRLVSSSRSVIHPEAVVLQMAASPHKAAAAENRPLDFTQFVFPDTDNTLLVETAGGLLSPVDARYTVADLISHYRMPAVLVTQHYLGSINHTLLCLEVMKRRNIPLLCLLINGQAEESTESFIRDYAGTVLVLRIPEWKRPGREEIAEAAAGFDKEMLNNIFYGGY